MNSAGNRAGIKRELMIEVWEALDCESVGAKEIEDIQRVVQEKLGVRESPAAIARTVADEGAVLRHPEVLECDARWREEAYQELDAIRALRTASPAEGANAMNDLERLRRTLTQASRESEIRRLMESVRQIREDRLLVAQSKVVDEKTRREACELAEWLGVWLSTPDLFRDWLDLRLNSPGFRRHFLEVEPPT